jgi:transcriptional regulator with XRE-family HTH domain
MRCISLSEEESKVAKFRVKELAKARGMSIEELAFKSGVKYSTVRNLWQGKVSNPNYSTLAAIAGAFGVAIEEMIDRSDRSDVQSSESKIPSLAAA